MILVHDDSSMIALELGVIDGLGSKIDVVSIVTIVVGIGTNPKRSINI